MATVNRALHCLIPENDYHLQVYAAHMGGMSIRKAICRADEKMNETEHVAKPVLPPPPKEL